MHKQRERLVDWKPDVRTEKSFSNLIKSNRNQIVITIFSNPSENSKYNLISVWLNKISLCVRTVNKTSDSCYINRDKIQRSQKLGGPLSRVAVWVTTAMQFSQVSLSAFPQLRANDLRLQSSEKRSWTISNNGQEYNRSKLKQIYPPGLSYIYWEIFFTLALLNFTSLVTPIHSRNAPQVFKILLCSTRY